MQWYEKDPERFELERYVVRQHHLRTKWVILEGRMRLRAKYRGRRDTYLTEVLYPPRYPHDKPRGFVLRPKLRASPHQLGPNEPCLEHGQWSPATTGAVWLNWFVEWLRAYEMYLDTGKWPDPDEVTY